MYLSVQWYFSFSKLIVKKNPGKTGTDITLKNYMTLYIYIYIYIQRLKNHIYIYIYICNMYTMAFRVKQLNVF
jgi:hypothetical protein